MVPIPVSLNREATSNINDNYLLCPTLSRSVVTKLDQKTLTRTVKSEVVDSSVLNKVQMTPSLNSQSVSYLAVDHAHSVCFQGQPQKKGISPCTQKIEIKDVKGVFCANQCLFAPHIPNVPNVAPSLAVGGRLQKFWQVWLTLGANLRVVSILREGYTLPFKIRPPLTRSPVIKSGYTHSGKSKALFQALIELINKLVVEKVVIRSSLAFYNRLFLVPKSNHRWRPILDLSHLNLFLKPGTFKMETPETMRLSLQRGESVTSLDFSDAYFHIPISQRSRKYLRFFLGKKAYQFTALPFGLAKAPLEFTKVVKEVKLMAQARDPPVPRRLVSQSSGPGNLPTTYPDPLGPVPGPRVGGKHGEIGAYASTGVQFCRLPVRSSVGSSFAHSGQMDHSSTETTVHQRQGQLFSPTVHVPNRAPYCHRETGMGRPPSHETGSVAPETTLACAREPGKDYSNSSLSPSTPGLVVRREQCPQGATFAPPATHPTDIYRRLKRRLGRTLRGIHSNFLELKAVLLALKSFEQQCKGQIVLIETDNTTVVSYINKEGGMRSGSLCALLWRLLSWCHPRKIVLRARHIPGRLNVIADKLSRHNQVIQTEWCLSQQV